jgi:hypothetical protein
MMSKYHVLRPFRSGMALCSALVLAAASNVLAEQPTDQKFEPSRLATYQTVTGDTSFALSLTPQVQLEPAVADVVLLVDTSASQSGLYRQDQLQAVSQFISGLNAADQILLVAVDVRAVPMHEDFVTRDSEQLAAGLKKLEHRVPLGSTDLAAALNQLSERFSDDANRARHIVYIGDGMSRANSVDAQEMRQVVANLVKHHVSFDSFVIGPYRDPAFMAALANHSGGHVLIDSDQAGSAMFAGTDLARSIHASVIWPEQVELSNAVSESFPVSFPPLRTDRDCILIGKLSEQKANEDIEIKVAGMVGGQQVDLKWTVTPETSNADFSFLPKLIEIARKDAGLTLPTLGSYGLRETGLVLINQSQALADMSARAAALGSDEDADRLAKAALNADPENLNAEVVQKLILKDEAVDDHKMSLVLQDEGDKPVEEVQIPQGIRLGGRKDDELLRNQLEDRARQASRLQAQVERNLDGARDLMKENPDAAIGTLKITLEEVENAPDLDAAIRQQLRNRLVVAIREADRKAIEILEAQRVAARTGAIAAERLKILDEAKETEERIKQLVVQFNSLVDEQRGMEAINVIVPQLEKLDPRSVLPAAASEYAQFYDNKERMQDLRDQRWRGAWLTLYEIDRSSIPTPDEPPIVYPDPEFWERITELRRKYKAVDLVNPDGAEAQIALALNDKTSFDFFEAPLTDVVTFLQDRHKINVELDVPGLDLAGVTPEDTVTKQLSNISLRSALRLLLKDLELTYVIKDEVLQITSQEAAGENLVTKVYNVGDLVVPIFSGGGGLGIGGGGGNLNGGGGGMGGGGGGGFGGGGGGFGGGGGGFGGGGGAFVVQDSLKLGSKKNSTESTQQTQPVKPVANRKAEILKVEMSDGQSADDAWDQYFASQDRIHPGDVQVTSVHLMRQEKFDQVVGLLNAALRHDQAQPWMYHGLALAMEAAGAPQADLERALTSALDTKDNADDTLRVAIYMNKIGLDRRAYELFHDLAVNNPTMLEPFANALDVALDLKDDQGIIWAASGILSQAWVDQEHPLRVRAINLLRAKYLEAKQSGNSELAKQIYESWGDAFVKDCVIKVTWTGEADIDLVVEEPSGSICSLNNPHTNAGGILLQGTHTLVKRLSEEGYTEMYMCPQAFAGDYRVLIKRVWGEPTLGKVQVTVIRHDGDPSESRETQSISLDENGKALVLFNLDSGRRNEPLEERQIATITNRQHQIDRAILGQMLGQFDNAEASAAYNASRGLPSFAELARLRRGAVGYRPVITTIPEGAFMSVTAVVSADRRYVRVTPIPQFTQIVSVSTFNFVTGNTGGGGGTN